MVWYPTGDDVAGAEVAVYPQYFPPMTRGPDLTAVPFTSVYRTDTEWVAEMANRTVHAAMHIGWVPDASGTGYHGQMAVLVKPNGLFGRLYMAAILPFRYTLVYPALLRSIGRGWVSG